MAAHSQVGIVPARPYKPKDKAKAEVAVLIVERWILARLRHQTFFTLAALPQSGNQSVVGRYEQSPLIRRKPSLLTVRPATWVVVEYGCSVPIARAARRFLRLESMVSSAENVAAYRMDLRSRMMLTE